MTDVLQVWEFRFVGAESNTLVKFGDLENYLINLPSSKRDDIRELRIRVVSDPWQR